jgi:hypothetical protein
LNNIPKGNHYIEFKVVSIELCIGLPNCATSKKEFTMTLNLSVVPPVITHISPQNQTYTSSKIPIVFNINEDQSWSGYSLDNLANVTINENTTITEISNGSHSLVIYANDTFGSMGKSDIVFFEAKTESFNPVIALNGIVEVM